MRRRAPPASAAVVAAGVRDGESAGARRPRVLVTRRLPASVMAKLQAACEVEIPAGDGPLASEQIRAHLRDKQALICVLTDRIDEAVLDAGRELRIVANVAVGYDNIDVTAARARGIVVTNTPDVLTDAVAEFTWGLILAITRRIVEGDRLVRRGAWRGWSLDLLLGMELRGKCLGIVGAGRIGRAVARRAPAFGMTVLVASPSGGGRASGGEGSAWPRVSLDELLVQADVVSLHVPLAPQTRHLIDRRALARMKRSAYLINTARGPVVDEAALVWALRERLIAGAALDVYEEEPRVHPGLLELDNVVLAPHLGSATRETRTAMAELAVENVLAVLAGRPPLTPVP
jgi:glyoxylate reductase